MTPGAELRFKTDDDELYEAALSSIQESGFRITAQTEDLYGSLPEDNIRTEHEAMYLEAGKTIKEIRAVFRD